jgi:hypothetical protein
LCLLGLTVVFVAVEAGILVSMATDSFLTGVYMWLYACENFIGSCFGVDKDESVISVVIFCNSIRLDSPVPYYIAVIMVESLIITHVQ